MSHPNALAFTELPIGKLLAKALLLEGPAGMCIHRAAAFVFDTPGAILVFGTFNPGDGSNAAESTVPFIHAWAEYRGDVVAPTTLERTGGRLLAIPRAAYYAMNGARDRHILTRPHLLRLDREHGLKRALRVNAPCRSGVSFGATLLDAAGVDWADFSGAPGGVVPADVERAWREANKPLAP